MPKKKYGLTVGGPKMRITVGDIGDKVWRQLGIDKTIGKPGESTKARLTKKKQKEREMEDKALRWEHHRKAKGLKSNIKER